MHIVYKLNHVNNAIDTAKSHAPTNRCCCADQGKAELVTLSFFLGIVVWALYKQQSKVHMLMLNFILLCAFHTLEAFKSLSIATLGEPVLPPCCSRRQQTTYLVITISWLTYTYSFAFQWDATFKVYGRNGKLQKRVGHLCELMITVSMTELQSYMQCSMSYWKTDCLTLVGIAPVTVCLSAASDLITPGTVF